MNDNAKTLRLQWTAALRSGKYTQGSRYLHPSEDTFCCLGVACDVSGLGKWILGEWILGEWIPEFDYQIGDVAEAHLLPEAVLDLYALSLDQEEHLAYLNDEKSQNFEQIADYIDGMEESC